MTKSASILFPFHWVSIFYIYLFQLFEKFSEHQFIIPIITILGIISVIYLVAVVFMVADNKYAKQFHHFL
uniref:Group-specific protein n=1 Tax=Heterorhabditis bacteriophora TaxID=37862 RepID=A0A1I7WQ92_HETBA